MSELASFEGVSMLLPSENPFDGLSSHLFTNTTVQQSDVLTRADIDSLFQSMYANSRAEPDMLYVSVKDRKRLVHWYRVGGIYRRYPVPAYKIRKWALRKIYAGRAKARHRLKQRERREAMAERAVMEGI